MASELNFEAHDLEIHNILFSNYKFKIPRYQRPYSWNEDQIVEFWNDLTNSDETYFLGSFIFNYENVDKTDFIDVIDGQQRILTITIFMAVIRDIAEEIDKGLSERIQIQDIAILDRKGKHLFRVVCGESTREFFEKFIQSNKNSIIESNPITKEEKNIKNNYQYFWDRITRELEKFDTNQRKIDYLENLREKISNLIVINIKIDTEESAYEIFETTNARGVDLNVADLLKNLIFKNIPIDDSDKDFVKEIWMEIVNNIQSSGFELNKFIRYYWISRYSFLTEKKLYREIKRTIVNWQEFLNDLWTASEWFNILAKGDQNDWKNKEVNHWEKIFKAITAINYMGVTQCQVFFLSLFRNYPSINTNPAWILDIIEKFTFNYSAVCKQPGNRIERLYSRYARGIQDIVDMDVSKTEKGRKIHALFTEMANELRELRPSREVFFESFLDIKYKKSEMGRSLIKYILGEINNHGISSKELVIDFLNVNIEHILPINPDSDWNLSKKDIKGYVDQLGNLTIIDKRINSSVGNSIIDKKIEEFKKSKLEINLKLVKLIKENKNIWNKEIIFKRQEVFATLSYDEIWNYQ